MENKHPIFSKHPKYSEEEEFIMNYLPQDLIHGVAPLYLRIRECVRRTIKEKTGMDYEKTALDLYDQLQDKMIDANLEGLASSFTPKPSDLPAYELDPGSNIKAGTERNNLYYVPYFKLWVPWEKYIILQPIGFLKATWNHDSRERGTELAKVTNELRTEAIARIRREWMESGYVEKIIDKVNEAHPDLVPLQYDIKEKLSTTFIGRSRKK